MSISWVMQTGAPERNGGCGIACLAMLTGENYNRIRELAPDLCEKCGVETDAMDHFLAQQGYAIKRVYPFRSFDGSVAEKWPPKPFADKHLVLVMQTRKDFVAHFVCMDKRGVVYDPADETFVKSRLSRYHSVEWVAGLYEAP